MIEKVLKKRRLSEFDEVKQNLEYWLTKNPEERVEAVELLRRQFHGNTGRLQRVARVTKRS